MTVRGVFIKAKTHFVQLKRDTVLQQLPIANPFAITKMHNTRQRRAMKMMMAIKNPFSTANYLSFNIKKIYVFIE